MKNNWMRFVSLFMALTLVLVSGILVTNKGFKASENELNDIKPGSIITVDGFEGTFIVKEDENGELYIESVEIYEELYGEEVTEETVEETEEITEETVEEETEETTEETEVVTEETVETTEVVETTPTESTTESTTESSTDVTEDTSAVYIVESSVVGAMDIHTAPSSMTGSGGSIVSLKALVKAGYGITLLNEESKGRTATIHYIDLDRNPIRGTTPHSVNIDENGDFEDIVWVKPIEIKEGIGYIPILVELGPTIASDVESTITGDYHEQEELKSPAYDEKFLTISHWEKYPATAESEEWDETEIDIDGIQYGLFEGMSVDENDDVIFDMSSNLVQQVIAKEQSGQYLAFSGINGTSGDGTNGNTVITGDVDIFVTFVPYKLDVSKVNNITVRHMVIYFDSNWNFVGENYPIYTDNNKSDNGTILYGPDKVAVSDTYKEISERTRDGLYNKEYSVTPVISTYKDIVNNYWIDGIKYELSRIDGKLNSVAKYAEGEEMPVKNEESGKPQYNILKAANVNGGEGSSENLDVRYIYSNPDEHLASEWVKAEKIWMNEIAKSLPENLVLDFTYYMVEMPKAGYTIQFVDKYGAPIEGIDSIVPMEKVKVTNEETGQLEEKEIPKVLDYVGEVADLVSAAAGEGVKKGYTYTDSATNTEYSFGGIYEETGIDYSKWTLLEEGNVIKVILTTPEPEKQPEEQPGEQPQEGTITVKHILVKTDGTLETKDTIIGKFDENGLVDGAKYVDDALTGGLTTSKIVAIVDGEEVPLTIDNITVEGSDPITDFKGKAQIDIAKVNAITDEDGNIKSVVVNIFFNEPVPPRTGGDDTPTTGGGDNTPTIVPTPDEPEGDTPVNNIPDAIAPIEPIAEAEPAPIPEIAVVPAPVNVPVDGTIPVVEITTADNGEGLTLTEITDVETALANQDLGHLCNLLYFLILLATSIILYNYFRNTRKHQERIFEIRKELGEDDPYRKQDNQ